MVYQREITSRAPQVKRVEVNPREQDGAEHANSLQAGLPEPLRVFSNASLTLKFSAFKIGALP